MPKNGAPVNGAQRLMSSEMPDEGGEEERWLHRAQKFTTSGDSNLFLLIFQNVVD